MPGPDRRRPDPRDAMVANGFRVFTPRCSVYAPPTRAPHAIDKKRPSRAIWKAGPLSMRRIERVTAHHATMASVCTSRMGADPPYRAACVRPGSKRITPLQRVPGPASHRWGRFQRSPYADAGGRLPGCELPPDAGEDRGARVRGPPGRARPNVSVPRRVALPAWPRPHRTLRSTSGWRRHPTLRSPRGLLHPILDQICTPLRGHTGTPSRRTSSNSGAARRGSRAISSCVHSKVMMT